MSRVKVGILGLAAAVLIAAPFVRAVPNLISYQGLLNDENGVPVNGTVSFVFGLYGTPSGGTAIWTEAQTISVSNGVFNVQLGAVQALPSSVFGQDTLYLGIKAGADAEMTPRQRLTTSAYSHRAETITPPLVLVPVGGIVAWNKSMTGTPGLASGWVECNGQAISDSESPYDGLNAPNLNGVAATQRFLRGGTTSGAIGGTETHSHTIASNNCGSGGPACIRTGLTNAASTLPSYYEVVWIMRVK